MTSPPRRVPAAVATSPLLQATRAGIDAAKLYAANAASAAFYTAQLGGHQPALVYLRRRGLAEAAGGGSPWQLGYAPPGWRSLVDHLRGRGFGDHELYAAGLATHGRHGQLLDRFRDRLTFPIHDRHGQIIGFTARDLSGDPDVPKYLNTPETAIYRKSRQLYGLGVHLQHRPPGSGAPLAVLVEGAADTIAIWYMSQAMATRPGAVPIYPVAPCGTTLTTGQLQLLRDTLPAGTRLAVAFDGDPAGRRAFARSYPLLRTWPGPTYAIALPDGRDPADLLATLGPAAGLAELARRMIPATRAALAATLDRLHTDQVITDAAAYPADRHRAIEAIAGYFLDDPADTPALAAAAANRLGIDEADLVQQVIAHTVTGHPEPPQTWASATAKGRRRHRTGATATHTHPATWRQAWALADGIGDRPQAAEAATRAAQVAAQVTARSTAAAGVAAAGAAIGGLGHDGDASIIAATAHPTDAGTRYQLAWSGNARAYTLHHGRLVQVTIDHTVAQQRRDADHPISPSGELEHLLTASARHGPVARTSVDVPAGGGLLLCSAGLYRHVDPAHLRQALGPVRDPQITTHRLVTNAEPGGENAAALLLHAPTPAVGGLDGPAAVARLASATPLPGPDQPAAAPPPPAAGRATTAELIAYLRSLVLTDGNPGPSHPPQDYAAAGWRR
jgi:DNA primase catalytic core